MYKEHQEDPIDFPVSYDFRALFALENEGIMLPETEPQETALGKIKEEVDTLRDKSQYLEDKLAEIDKRWVYSPNRNIGKYKYNTYIP